MSRTLPKIAAAVGAIVLAAGTGAAAYALVDSDGTNTVVREVATGVPTATTSGLSVGQVYSRAHDGVVEITVSTGGGQAQGSGFVYDEEGHIVTNQHVVDGANTARCASRERRLLRRDRRRYRPLHRSRGDEGERPRSVLTPLALGDSSRLAGRRHRDRDRQPVRPRGDRHVRHRERSPAPDGGRRTASRSTTRSRPTLRSTTATPAARSSTCRARRRRERADLERLRRQRRRRLRDPVEHRQDHRRRRSSRRLGRARLPRRRRPADPRRRRRRGWAAPRASR